MSSSPTRRMRSARLLPSRSVRSRLATSAIVALIAAVTGCAAVRTSGPGNAAESRPERTHAGAENDERERLESATEESSALPAEDEAPRVRMLVVKATAYNSTRAQTDSTPSIGAWGDRLRPGMKVIAVSKDLLEMGLRRGQRVHIRGLEGEYVVLDRMPSRWRQKIDIFMGQDIRAARAWGVREVEIRWTPEEDEDAVAESAPPGEAAEDERPDVDSEGD
ncbi:MAG: hypothetical protein R3F35_13050 [Myxococcota bacterium]